MKNREEELFNLEQELDIPIKDRFYQKQKELKSNWIPLCDSISPNKCTPVLVYHKSGEISISFFDGDGRFYYQDSDTDITDMILYWQPLPEEPPLNTKLNSHLKA